MRHSSGGAVERSLSPLREQEHETVIVTSAIDDNNSGLELENDYQDDVSSPEDLIHSRGGSESPILGEEQQGVLPQVRIQ